mgnify:CR=1 FL=1
MCSIIGFSGKEVAAPIIVKGLKRMEYRGYDSVGVATESDNKIELKKGTGKVNEVNSKIQLDSLPGKVGIGHTRWATHGKVTELNAHPHPSNSGKIAIVHNGIIENFEELKKQLEIITTKLPSTNIKSIIVNNYEADDVLGTIGKTLGVGNTKVLIYSGDSDLHQLIDDNIHIITTSRNGEIIEYNKNLINELTSIGFKVSILNSRFTFKKKYRGHLLAVNRNL